MTDNCKVNDCQKRLLVADIEQLRLDFREYANHKPDCAGGDGNRCACGYLDIYTALASSDTKGQRE